MRIMGGLSMAWINAGYPRSSRIFAGHRSAAASRARTFVNAGVHGEARWGRAWHGRCRMKSRSDTTPAHSIITKPWTHPPSVLLSSLPPSLPPPLRIVGPCNLYTRGWRIQRHDEPTREFTIDPQPWVRPILLFPPSICSLLVLFLFVVSACPLAVLVHQRDCDPSIDPVPGILAVSFQPTAPENVKWMFWDRVDRTSLAVQKPDSIPLRPAKGQRMSYNVTASSKEDKSISRLRRISLCNYWSSRALEII